MDRDADSGWDDVLFDGIEAKQLRARVFGELFSEQGSAHADPIKIGRYTVLERIGAGGMGVVYAAYDSQLDRKIAVKLLHGRGHDDAEARARLMREAQALARLSHPRVVQIHDVGEFEGRVFLAMEFVKGRTLRGWLASEVPTPREIVEVLSQAGQGLGAAHAAGIVHRDFKPDNVVVSDRVTVVDFGVARSTEPAAAPGAPDPGLPADHPLTRTGALVGTPAYMAPEQLAGDDIGPASDQFAFGVTLYEALYGARPFQGDTLAELKASIDRGRPAAPATPRVPSRIRRALERMLSVDPGDRFPSMDDALAALRPAPLRARSMLALAGAALAVWAVADFGVGMVEGAHEYEAQQLATQRDAERDRADTAEAELRRREDAVTLREARQALDDDPTRAIALLKRISDDGWSTEASEVGAHARAFGVASHFEAMEPNRWLGHTAAPLALDWLAREGPLNRFWLWVRSPDGVAVSDGGLSVARFDDGAVQLWRAGENAPTTIGSQPEELAALMLAPGAKYVATYAPPLVRVWSADGGDPRVTKLPGSPFAGFMALAPDGEQLALCGADDRLVVVDLDRGTRRSIAAKIEGQLRYSPDGRYLVAVAVDGALVVWRRDDFKLVVRDDEIRAQVPTFSAKSQILAAWDGASAGAGVPRLVAWDLANEQRRALGGELDPDDWVELSTTVSTDDVVVRTSRGEVGVWDLATGAFWRPRTHEPVRSAALNDDGTVLRTLDIDGLRSWDVPLTGHKPLVGHEGSVHALQAAPDGSLYSGGEDGTVRRWNPETGHGEVLYVHGISVHGVATGGDIVASYGGGELQVWRAGRLVYRTRDARAPIAVAAELTEVVYVTKAGQLAALDVASGVVRYDACPVCATGTWSVGWKFSPGGRYLATGLAEAGRVWDRIERREVFSAEVPWRLWSSTAVDSKGRWALFDGDATVRIDLNSGEQHAWESDPRWASTLIEDGWVVLASGRGDVDVWDPELGVKVALSRGRAVTRPRSIAASATEVFVGGDKGTIHRFVLPARDGFLPLRADVLGATDLEVDVGD